MKSPLEECRLTTSIIPHWDEGACFELRALGVWDPARDPQRRFARTAIGYYDDPEAMARDAASLSGRSLGVYLIPNPLSRDLICRSKNRIGFSQRYGADDGDVLRRRWLLVDADPVRKPGISATEEEHDLAIARVQAVQHELAERGQQGVIVATSGNGAHLLIPLDAPNSATERLRCERVLRYLAEKYSDDRVTVAREVFNASRLIRFYGTKACKGSDCPEEGRPHRYSHILGVDGIQR